MEQILVIGNAGGGKSTFATQLAEKTGLPLIHLDRLYWRGNWEHLSREGFDGNKASLYHNVLTFNRQHRKDYYALLEECEKM